ncbi:RsiV family protein [Aquimarina celericrescens]|uniref:RsiV family protein n=1 Tax=Aquimarina celericrescens TaxID=1964542 RepID=A0ABW5AYD7_9FLAO|nr:DUF3298 domain-containing protein [Aquimarina celericrescens]
MINTKTNITFWITFVIGFFLVITSCTTKEAFTFEKQNFTVDSLLDCKNIECASIEITLLKIVEETPVSKNINQEIERMACSVLNIGENETMGTLREEVNQFNVSYQEIHEKFGDEIPQYEANINCELGFACKSLISLALDSYIFTGGAHGYGSLSFLNIDTKTGKRIANKDLFKNYTEFENYAERVFRSTYEILENESINSTGFFFENDTFTLPENIGFTDTEVILYYNPYEISSYAEGPVEIKIKKEDVASYFAFDVL